MNDNRLSVCLNAFDEFDKQQIQLETNHNTLKLLEKETSRAIRKLDNEVKDANRFFLKFLAGYLTFATFFILCFRFIIWN